jgi:hypothetical protein
MGQRHTSPADRGGVQNAGGYLMLEKFSAEDTYTIPTRRQTAVLGKSDSKSLRRGIRARDPRDYRDYRSRSRPVPNSRSSWRQRRNDGNSRLGHLELHFGIRSNQRFNCENRDRPTRRFALPCKSASVQIKNALD